VLKGVWAFNLFFSSKFFSEIVKNKFLVYGFKMFINRGLCYKKFLGCNLVKPWRADICPTDSCLTDSCPIELNNDCSPTTVARHDIRPTNGDTSPIRLEILA
jgi:hypothetical protein